MRIALVYELTDNPYFSSEATQYDDRLSEFVQPTEINKITQTFKELGHQVDIIDGPLGVISEVDHLKKSNSIIFNKSIGFKGLERKIHVPAICMLFGIPFVGSSAYGMTLARHKYHTNKLLKGIGIRVPESKIIYPGESLKDLHIKFPVLVKPNHESDALGITDESIFRNEDGLSDAIKKLHDDFKQPVIIEEYISGEEWKIPIIGNNNHSEAKGCVGVFKKGRMMTDTLQTREDVIQDTMTYYVPEDNAKVNKAKIIAEKIHNQFELRDYSRIDFRISSENELVCMEVSTHPFIGDNSSFINGCMQSFTNFGNVMKAILNSSMERYRIMR